MNDPSRSVPERNGARNVTSRKSQHALLLRGFKTAPISGVRLEDCTFDGVAKPDIVEHVTGLVRRNVTVNGAKVAS